MKGTNEEQRAILKITRTSLSRQQLAPHLHVKDFGGWVNLYL